MPPKGNRKTKNGQGIFSDILKGVTSAVDFLGGRLDELEKKHNVPKYSDSEYLDIVHNNELEVGSGIWDSVKNAAESIGSTVGVAKAPITHDIIRTVLPVAVKVLAGRIHVLEKHVKAGDYKIAGSYEVAGETKKPILGRSKNSKPPVNVQRAMTLEDLL